MATTSAREAELLAAFRQHFAAEVASDVEKTLAGVTDDIVYEHPFRLDTMQGRDAVRDYYTRTWAERPFFAIEIVRYWFSGSDTIMVEVDTKFGSAGQPGGHVRTLCIGVFQGNLLAREIVYSGPELTSASGVCP